MAKGTIGVVPGYASAIRNFKPTAATVRAVAPTPAKQKILGPVWTAAGSSLANAIGGGQKAASSNLNTAIGAAQYTPKTTVETMSPIKVYENEILSDPGFVAAQGSHDATLSNLALARKDAIDRAVINAGWDPGSQLPTSAQSYAGDIDQATRDAASQNQLSTRAQLQDQFNNAMHVLPYQLAATGMGRSGQVGVQGSEYNKQFQTATNQGMSDLLNAILGHVSNYASGVTTADSALEQARLAIAQQLQNQAGYSRSIVESGGGGGDYSDIGPTIPGAPNILKAVDTTGRTGYSQNPATGAYSYNPTKTAVAKVIKSIGIKKAAKRPANIGQIAKNMMGG